MNEFVTLLNSFKAINMTVHSNLTPMINSFKSQKIIEHSNLTPMIDIKMNVFSENYSLAASQIRTNIQHIQLRNPNITDDHAGVQVLQMIHNCILDMDHKHHYDYMVGLFSLIESKLSVLKLKDELVAIQSYSQDLNQPESKKGLIKVVQDMNKKDFKGKEAILLFVAQMLSTHDYLIALKDKHL